VSIRALWQERFGIDAPRKIICVGLNYSDHAEEQGTPAPAEPLLFAKFANALLEPDEPIVLPRESTHTDAEAELAVVICGSGRRVPPERALELVAGYTVANDVSARNLQ
jgi:2-keto-4-pentenoate hydratase/2-oxohepta-3-ene-1,7-dioic acid hydratase in catechol pathway